VGKQEPLCQLSTLSTVLQKHKDWGHQWWCWQRVLDCRLGPWVETAWSHLNEARWSSEFAPRSPPGAACGCRPAGESTVTLRSWCSSRWDGEDAKCNSCPLCVWETPKVVMEHWDHGHPPQPCSLPRRERRG
jgi:hypothetical protein